MELAVLLVGLETVSVSGDLAVPITAVTCDSRSVSPGALFVAISGFKTDGHRFVDQAIKAGAAAVVVEHPVLPEGASTPQIVVANSRQTLSHLSAVFYGHPSARFPLIGVTGTNGKTTTAFLVQALFQQAGFTAGLIGTAGNRIGGEEVGKESKNTTPDPVHLHRLFTLMAERKAEVVVMEVTSHALVQHRVDDAEYAVAIFTNLTHEHLDFHKDMEGYFTAKALLFQGLKPGAAAVINIDDPYGRRMLEEVPAGCRILTYGFAPEAEIRAEQPELSGAGTRFRLVTPAGSADVTCEHLFGYYNISNALAAVGAALARGVAFASITTALRTAKGAPGRFERVDAGQDFLCVIDYAHTPDGFEKLFASVEAMNLSRVISVFGSAGERDHSKRPEMGRIAARYSDLVVLTEEDTRSENTIEILTEIASGVIEEVAAGAADCDYVIIEDRAQAIDYAVRLASTGDIVLVLGKGNEEFNEVNHPTEWDGDVPTAARAIEKRLSS